MKQEKLFRVTLADGVYHCKTISAVMDLLREKNVSLPPWRIWKLSKEIGDNHVFIDYGLVLDVLPIYVHQNPNKGKYKRK